jgi:hypothetical protein
MFKKKKIRLYYLFLAGISVILLITVSLLGYASIQSVHRLEKYAIEKNTEFFENELLLSKVKCNCLIKYNFYDE